MDERHCVNHLDTSASFTATALDSMCYSRLKGSSSRDMELETRQQGGIVDEERRHHISQLAIELRAPRHQPSLIDHISSTNHLARRRSPGQPRI